MKNSSSYVPAKKWPRRRIQSNVRVLPQVLDFSLQPMDYISKVKRAIPSRLLMVRINPDDPSADQLYLDDIPVPREAWRFNTDDHILIWHGAYGGGHIQFGQEGKICSGIIGRLNNRVNVSGGSRIQFTCQVALDAGVTYIESNGIYTGLSYDPDSPEWKSADWGPQRLRMTYTYKNNGFGPFTFEDLLSGDIPWTPNPLDVAASLTLGELPNSPLMVWNLYFKSQFPPPDDYGAPSDGPNSVYPYLLDATEDAGSTMIVGGMQIDDLAPEGTLIGMQGFRTSDYINGYYRTSAKAMAFGIFDGRMKVDGKKIGRSWISGNTLSWNSLPQEIQRNTGLPENGSLVFNTQGSKGINKSSGLQAYRLSAAAAADSIRGHLAHYPDTNNALQQWTVQLDGGLDIYGLLGMTPFKKDPTNGTWYDAIQQVVTNNLGTIMNSFIDPAMWKLLFPSVPQPVLTGELAKIANSPVKGVDDPTLWYQSLSAAVLTQGMADGDDPNCKNMNGPRAAAWLSTQVSTSPVYYAHGQQLFQSAWLDANPTFGDYLVNQIEEAEQYKLEIDNEVSDAIEDIQENVVTDKNSPPDLVKKMIAEVEAAGEYAKENNLYWAFSFYAYNTSVGMLNNIGIQIGEGNNVDNSTLTRMFQTVSTVLTALDPSGFFARQYNITVNVFLTTNTLPSMYGFTGDAENYSLIVDYLQQFVDDNIDNEDKDIADAAAQIAEIIASDNYLSMVDDLTKALQSFADATTQALAFPFIANKLVGYFKTNYPPFAGKAELFCGLFTSGIMLMGCYNLYTSFKNWSHLSREERAVLITDTLQLGIQIVGGIMKRGVRAYAVFSASSLTGAQRVGAAAKTFTFGNDAFGEASTLDSSVSKLGGTMAKWVGGTEGSFASAADGALTETTSLLTNQLATEEEVSMVLKVFGKNLDEFISTRLGPIMILAGMGYSIYQIATGDKGLTLVNDCLNLVAGGLMLMATVGGMIAEGTLATILCCAGPLAVVVALAGVGLMLYMILHKKPDPVKQFVDDYCKPAGFYVSSKCSAIDYAVPYENPDQNDLMMLGSTFSYNGQYLRVDNTGSVGLGQNNYLPEYVWFITTDGQGLSRIAACLQPADLNGTDTYYLSLLADNTICFRQAMSVNGPVDPLDETDVVTQIWYSNPMGNAVLTSDDKFMQSLPLNLQPVFPQNGNYTPDMAKGYIQQSGNTVVYNPSAGTTFTLTMQPLAPNYLRMVDLKFFINTIPSSSQSWHAVSAVSPSTPLTFSNQGNLPPFLEFDSNTGYYSPDGRTKVQDPYNSNNTAVVTNAVGTASADFTITATDPVKAPTLAPMLVV